MNNYLINKFESKVIIQGLTGMYRYNDDPDIYIDLQHRKLNELPFDYSKLESKVHKVNLIGNHLKQNSGILLGMLPQEMDFLIADLSLEPIDKLFYDRLYSGDDGHTYITINTKLTPIKILRFVLRNIFK